MTESTGSGGAFPGDDRRTGFVILANRLCLDFVNTEVVLGRRRTDLLDSYADLADWAEVADAVSPAEAAVARRRWAGAEGGRIALARARDFRSALRVVAERIVARKRVPSGGLAALNRVLAAGGERLRVERSGRGFALRRELTLREPGDLLLPVARSAAELLTADDLSLVRRCASPRCILFFYDGTKNHRRRWCSMATCGNRAKTAAYYRRERTRKAAGRARR